MSGDLRYTAIVEAFGGVGAILFVVFYMILSPWFRNAVGRNVMFFEAALGFIFSYSAIYYFFEFPHLVPKFMVRVDEVVITLIVLLTWQRLFQMIRAQISTRAKSRKKVKHDDE